MVYKELDLVGSTLSNYKITEKLGSGGMATVYKAHELSLNRIVALKVLSAKLADDVEFIKRFQREAQAAAKLNHPNIVQIYAIGEEKGIHFFAMEYTKGSTLSEILKEQKTLSPESAVSFIKQIALGLSVAHKAGLIHRDIKPSNILVNKKNIAKLADFGIAFVQDAKTKLTREGSIIGTPEYLSPEQCEGKTLDGRSDLYSLGVTLYELLTGNTPYEADTPVSMIMKIVSGKFPPLSEVKPDLPKKLQDIVAKMMNTSVSERYENAEKVIEDIESFEKEYISGIPVNGLGTNILNKKEISEIVDYAQKKPTSSSGKRAFLFVAAIIILLVGIGIAAKLLYFDKQNNSSSNFDTVSGEVVKTEDPQNNEPFSEEEKENDLKSTDPDINETKKTDPESTDSDGDETNNDALKNEENNSLNDDKNNNSDIKKETLPDPEIKNEEAEKVKDSKIVQLELDKNKATRLPPEKSFAISLRGNNRNVELVSSYMQNILQKKKYIIIDPEAAAGKPVKEIARSHMIISVNDLGSNTLKYYGRETTEYKVNISIKLISPQTGRIVKGPVNRTVSYTNLNIDENFKEAVDKLILSLNL